LPAPIVAVCVYTDRARVTRRGSLRLPAGEQRVLLDGLPVGLHADSLRVSGRGPATVLGVEVLRRHHARTAAGLVAELERQRRELTADLVTLDDGQAVAEQRRAFLANLAERAGRTYARSLAAGTIDAAGVAAFADALGEQLAAVHATRRGLAGRRDELRDELAAVERQLAEVSTQREPDRLTAAIILDVATDEADIEIELAYVVGGAQWQSVYDVRLDTDRLALTWFALVTQHTGEDWPESELTLSTARPSGPVTVPELDPWYLDRLRPVVPLRRARDAAGYGMAQSISAPGGGVAAPPAEAEAETAFAPLQEATATVEQGVAAATYRPARPVAVPADGAPHRAVVAVIDLAATLDYVTAPVRGPEAHLRATVVNASAHTLPPGAAAVFHGGDFVGSTQLEMWAPGEEVELALGVDDRVRVERELARRTATKAALGSTRRREVEYRITVANHTPRPARVTVLDQLPVSRDAGITVRELRVEPPPSERTDLGGLTWRLELPPGESREIYLGIRVDQAKGVELAGWRE
jgi:uncharacterized protein (TIGR02231 family)